MSSTSIDLYGTARKRRKTRRSITWVLNWPAEKNYETIDFPPLTEEQKEELPLLQEMDEDAIDTSDIPKQVSGGQFYYFQSLKIPKKDIHTQIDIDNLEWLRKNGKGCQTRLNAVIRWARMNGCPIAKL